MSDFRDRVVAEKTELDAKLGRLRQFLRSEPFLGLPHDEQRRLERQSDAMSAYSAILGDRIAAFPPVSVPSDDRPA